MPKPTSLVAALLISLLLSAVGQAEPPRLARVLPPCLEVGRENCLQLAGQQFAEGMELVLPFPADLRVQSVTLEFARIQITPKPGTRPGIYPFRLRTAAGLSNLRLVAVADIPVVLSKEPNDRPEQAQAISGPTIAAGDLSHPATDTEIFRFTAAAGERLTLATETRRLGLSPDLMLWLCDAQGRSLAYADNTPGLCGDERIDYTFAESGEYLVKVHDADFSNHGWTNLFALKIGPFNYARTVFPLGGKRGQPLRVTVIDRDGNAIAQEAQVPGDPWEDRWQLPLGNFPASLSWTLAAGDWPECFEPGEETASPGIQPSNRSADEVPRIAWPATMNGRIREPGEEDRYRLEVQPGQHIRVLVDAFYLGSPLDGHLLIYDPQGKQLLAQNNDRQLRSNIDPGVSFQVPQGVHEVTIALRDAFSRGGVEYAYRLTVEPGGPDFYLALGKETFQPLNDRSREFDAADTLNLPMGEEVSLGVTVLRTTREAPYYPGPQQGYQGPIELKALNVPDGVTVLPATIPAGSTEGSLTVVASADAPLEPFEIVVVGEAQREDGTLFRRVAERRLFLAEPAFTNLPWNWLSRKVTCAIVRSGP